MADFAASDLVTAATARFGSAVLRQRVAPGGDNTAKDLELTKIAQSVIGAVQAAAQAQDQWPLPGQWPAGSVSPVDGSTDVSGVPYRAVWPYNLIDQAMRLFDFRSYSGEVIPTEKIKVGQMAELFFLNVSKGLTGLGLGVSTDVSSPAPEAARDRQGRSLLNDGSSNGDRLAADFMTGVGWDNSMPGFGERGLP